MIHEVKNEKEFKKLLKLQDSEPLEVRWGRAYFKFYPCDRTKEDQKEITQRYIDCHLPNIEPGREGKFIQGAWKSSGKKEHRSYKYRTINPEKYRKMRAQAAKKI